MSGESIAQKVIIKVTARPKLLHRKNKYLTPNLRCLLCNNLIQPYIDYSCSEWSPSLSKKSKYKILTSQNKCIRFCLQLDKMAHKRIRKKEFETINWLPIKDRFNQCKNSIIFKYFDKKFPHILVKFL